MDENVCGEEEVECCDECGRSEDDCQCCSDCAHYPCECCENCGYYPCECCSECGDSCCSCGSQESGSMGSSDVPGWVARGHKSVACVSSDSGWQRVWPEIDNRHFDPCVEASNFYLLEAIANNAPNRVRPVKAITFSDSGNDVEMLHKLGVSKSKQKTLIKNRDKMVAERRESDPDYDLAWLMRDAAIALDEVVDRADATLVGYFHMACAGEARHHRAIGGTVLTGGRNRAAAWVGWRTVYDQVGPEAIKDIAVLLGEITGGTYGGALWKQAAEILYERVTGTLGPDEKTTKRLFVDRAWTLEHNGGCFLNKIEWACKNNRGWTLDALKSRVLNAHAENPANWRVLCQVASEPVVEMFDRYWEITNRQRELSGMEPIPNPRLNVKTRTMCKSCWSDPARGHMAGCKSPFKHDFDGGDLSNGGKSWFMVVDEEDWNQYNWSKWNKKEYPVGPDGSFFVHELDKVRVVVDVRLEKHLHGRTYLFEKKMTIKELRESGDLIEGKLSDQLTSGHKLGWKETDEIYSVSIKFNVTVRKHWNSGLLDSTVIVNYANCGSVGNLDQKELVALLDEFGTVNLGEMFSKYAPTAQIKEATENDIAKMAEEIKEKERLARQRAEFYESRTRNRPRLVKIEDIKDVATGSTSSKVIGYTITMPTN